MPEKPPASITITKIEGARRQIEAAVSLWFKEGDPVVIHTLIAAGHHVCHDIAKATGQSSPILFNNSMFPGIEWAEHKKITLELENFLKHAERDSGSKITFHPRRTDFYILDAILLYSMIGGPRNALFEAFGARFTIAYLSELEDAVKLIGEIVISKYKELPRADFLAHYLRACYAHWRKRELSMRQVKANQ